MPKVQVHADKYRCERGCKLSFATKKHRTNHYRYCGRRQAAGQPGAQQLEETIGSYDIACKYSM